MSYVYIYIAHIHWLELVFGKLILVGGRTEAYTKKVLEYSRHDEVLEDNSVEYDW